MGERGCPSPSNCTAVYSVWRCLLAAAAASAMRLRTGSRSPSSLGPTRLSRHKPKSEPPPPPGSPPHARTRRLGRNDTLTRVYLVEDDASTLEEALLHVLPSQSAGLQEYELCNGDDVSMSGPETSKEARLKKQEDGTTVLLSEAGRLQEGHLSVCIQVFLVATEDDDDIGTGQSPGVRQPVGEGVVRLPAGAEIKETLLPDKWNSLPEVNLSSLPTQ